MVISNFTLNLSNMLGFCDTVIAFVARDEPILFYMPQFIKLFAIATACMITSDILDKFNFKDEKLNARFAQASRIFLVNAKGLYVATTLLVLYVYYIL